MNPLDPMPKLLCTTSDRSININSNPFSVGRGLNCDYVVTNQIVSRLHCQFEKLGDQWYLRDKSTNGTFLNDVLIKSTLSPPLKDQDAIQLSEDSNKYIFQCSDNISDEQLCQITDSLLQTIKDAHYTSVSNMLNIFKTAANNLNNEEQENKRIKLALDLAGSNVIDLTNDSAQTSSIVIEPSVIEIDLSDSYAQPSTSNVNNNIVKISEKKDKEEIPSTSNSAPRAETESHQSDHDNNDNQEFLCAICSELFVKASTLNCSHTFCKHCIETWRTKQNVCPICRTKITSQNATLVLDNFIEKIMQSSTKEEQDRRKELLEERKKENEKNKKYIPKPAHVLIHDNTDQSTDTEDDEDYDLDMGDYWSHVPYYGGYGSCFTCGRRGHWSRGCPFR